MKLLNQSIKHLSLFILIIIGIWGMAFFFNMIDEIKENTDEGLDNFKRQIIYRAHRDTSVLTHVDFEEAFYAIREIEPENAIMFQDQYTDTVIYIQNVDDPTPRPDPVRMLTTTFEDDGKYFELKIINPMVEKEDLIRRLLWNMIWLYVALIITIILVNNIVLKKMWKPFYRLLHKIQNYELGGGGRRPMVRTEIKEFLDLQKAVDGLLNQNIRVYEQQKQFTGNASHELQTPLAIAINKLELLIEKGNLDNEQSASIAETMQILERLSRLNKSLLLLSKIETRQFPDHRPVSVNGLIREKMMDLKEIAAHRQVSVDFEEEGEIIKSMDPALADILISNLLRNALYHNISGGRIRLRIGEDQILIENTGSPAPLDPDQIFKRFYISSSKKRSSGLGLAIVKAIGDLYGMTITYEFYTPFHRFRLNF